MATTLLELAEEQQAARQLALDDAQAAFDTAQTADKAAEISQTQAAAALLDANTELDDARKQLAVAQTPADIAALSIVVRDKTIAQRQAADALAAAEFSRNQVAAELGAAQRAVESANRQHEASLDALTAAQAIDDRRQSIIDVQLADPPLADIVTAATDALASPEYLDAKARIENALPAALRTRAFERSKQSAAVVVAWKARLDAAQEAFDDEVEAAGLDIDKLNRLHRALNTADAALSQYVATAGAKLAAAQNNLKRIAASTAPAVTPAQKASLDNLQGTARPDAATAEKARDDAAVDFAEAAAKLKAERIKALAGTPDGDIAAMEADDTNFPDLAQAKEDYDNAEDAYEAAVSAYTASMQLTLAQWQAEVPEGLWSEAATFYAAEEQLNALKVAPTALVTAVETAETNLLAAMEDADERGLRLEYVMAALTDEQSLAETAAKNGAQRQALALRGALRIDPTQWL